MTQRLFGVPWIPVSCTAPSQPAFGFPLISSDWSKTTPIYTRSCCLFLAGVAHMNMLCQYLGSIWVRQSGLCCLHPVTSCCKMAWTYLSPCLALSRTKVLFIRNLKHTLGNGSISPMVPCNLDIFRSVLYLDDLTLLNLGTLLVFIIFHLFGVGCHVICSSNNLF